MQPFEKEVTIYVGDLEPNIDEMQLTNIFSRYGNVKQVQLRRDMYTH